MATTQELEKEYAKYGGDRTGAINQMYDAQKEASISQLESAYNQSKGEAEAARDKLPGQYQQQANDLAVQYERNRRNFNQQAAGSGMNTGTASQAQLAMNSTWQRDYGNLRTAQADAVSEADRGIASLESQYQSSISAAIAQNDYQKAAALLDEFNNQYSRDLTAAQTLASYGDFSGYANIYGETEANNMYNIWKAQNPDIAYRTGNISAEEYRQMTGSYPAGYTPPNSGGGYYAAPTPTPETDTGAESVGLDPRGMSAINTQIYNARNVAALQQAVQQAAGAYNSQMTTAQQAAVDRALAVAVQRLGL